MTTSVHRLRPFLVSALFVSVLFASTLLASLALAPGAIAQSRGDNEYCAADGPESVLRCMAEAYAERDVDAYRRLLADDFVFVLAHPGDEPGDESNSWGIDVEMKVHRQMFEAAHVQAMSLTFADGYRVTPGDEPETWTISGISVELVMDSIFNGEPTRYQTTGSNLEFRVRCVPEPQVHYVIYRWWEEE